MNVPLNKWINELENDGENKVISDKGYVVPLHATKASKRNRGMALLILNLGTRWG
jgi:hypothetical protein